MGSILFVSSPSLAINIMRAILPSIPRSLQLSPSPYVFVFACLTFSSTFTTIHSHSLYAKRTDFVNQPSVHNTGISFESKRSVSDNDHAGALGILDLNSSGKLLPIQGHGMVENIRSPDTPIPRRHHHEHKVNEIESRRRTERNSANSMSRKNRYDRHRHGFTRPRARFTRAVPPRKEEVEKEDTRARIPTNGSMLMRGLGRKKRSTTTTTTTTAATTTELMLPTATSIQHHPRTTELIPPNGNKMPLCADLCNSGMGGLLCDCDILPIG